MMLSLYSSSELEGWRGQGGKTGGKAANLRVLRNDIPSPAISPLVVIAMIIVESQNSHKL